MFVLSALVAVGLYLANASPLVVRQDLTCARNYTIALGDTCDRISAAQNVSSFQLLLDNSNIVQANCSDLQVGQVLCLGFVGQDCTDVHAVATNETCNAIATITEIPLATLLGNNPNVDTNCTNIHPGEVLCTASEIINYTL